MGGFTVFATSGHSSKNILYSRLRGETLLIVALNLLQHVKYLSEISAVFEPHHKSIFTLQQLSVGRDSCPTFCTAG